MSCSMTAMWAMWRLSNCCWSRSCCCWAGRTRPSSCESAESYAGSRRCGCYCSRRLECLVEGRSLTADSVAQYLCRLAWTEVRYSMLPLDKFFCPGNFNRFMYSPQVLCLLSYSNFDAVFLTISVWFFSFLIQAQHTAKTVVIDCIDIKKAEREIFSSLCTTSRLNAKPFFICPLIKIACDYVSFSLAGVIRARIISVMGSDTFIFPLRWQSSKLIDGINFFFICFCKAVWACLHAWEMAERL